MDKNLLKRKVLNHLSTRQIALETNLSQTTIRYWLKQHGLITSPKRQYKCSRCGETNPEKFYGHKKKICGKCHNYYCRKSGTEKRNRILRCFGEKCSICGYDKHKCSLDLHHKDATQKDKTFSSIRSWSWERIEKEIKKCILICRNCHQAVHCNEIDI